MSAQRKGSYRVIKITAAVVGLFVLAALIIPFLVDLSSLKPQIQSVVSSNVNARVDFQSARLRILPTIGIKLEKVAVENSDAEFNGTRLFAVDDVLIDAKLFPLLTGKVVGNVVIKKPEILMVRKGLKNNLSSLAKNDGTQPPKTEEPTPQKPAQTPEQQAQTMAQIKEKVLIEAVVIEKANITIRDIASENGAKQDPPKEPIRINDLNIKVTNIGLDRDIGIAIDTNVDVSEAGAIVKGPIRMNNVVRVAMGGKGLEKATFSGKLSYDDLSIQFRDAFKKASGIPLNVAFDGTFVPGDFTLQNLVVNFHNLKVESSAHIVDFKDPRLSATLKVANDNLASLGDLLPKHRDMLINGQLRIDAGAEGKISGLDSLALRFLMDAKLTGTDLNVKLGTTGVMPFKGNLAVNSHRIDVDALLKPFMKSDGAAQQPAASPQPQASTSPESKTPPKDFELSPEQKKLLTGTDAEIRVDLKEIVYSGLKITNFKVDLDQKNLIGSLNQFNIDGFGGKIAAKGTVHLSDSPISFNGDFKMQDIHPEQVMLVVKPEHKDLLIGRMNLDLGVRGRGTTVPTLNKTLNGAGSFKFNDGQLNTPSISAKMQEQFDKYVESLSVSSAGEGIINSAKKLLDSPLAKAAGKNPPDIDKLKDQYKDLAKVKIAGKTSTSKDLKDVAGKLEIKDGKIYIVTTKTDNDGTMDVKSFVDLEMNLGGGAVYTASQTTKQNLLSQSKYADLLMDDKGNLILNLGLAGTVTDPKVSLSSDSMRASFQKKAQALVEKEVKQAAEAYIKNLMGGGGAKDAAKDKAQAEAKKRQEEAKAKAMEEAKKHEGKAKDALKGLFGR